MCNLKSSFHQDQPMSFKYNMGLIYFICLQDDRKEGMSAFVDKRAAEFKDNQNTSLACTSHKVLQEENC